MTKRGASNGRAGRAASPGAWTPLQEVLSTCPPATGAGALDDRPQFAVGERAPLGKVVVICSEDGASAIVADELKIDLPRDPNTATVRGDVTAMWLSPCEWMLVTPDGQTQKLIAALERAFAGTHALVVDVSDRWTVVAVTGTDVLPVLKKGTSVQLQWPADGIGRCCQTHLFRTPVIIRQTDESPSFDIYVDATLAEYLWQWFEHAADGLDVRVLETP